MVFHAYPGRGGKGVVDVETARHHETTGTFRKEGGVFALGNDPFHIHPPPCAFVFPVLTLIPICGLIFCHFIRFLLLPQSLLNCCCTLLDRLRFLSQNSCYLPADRKLSVVPYPYLLTGLGLARLRQLRHRHHHHHHHHSHKDHHQVMTMMLHTDV